MKTVLLITVFRFLLAASGVGVLSFLSVFCAKQAIEHGSYITVLGILLVLAFGTVCVLSRFDAIFRDEAMNKMQELKNESSRLSLMHKERK